MKVQGANYQQVRTRWDHNYHIVKLVETGEEQMQLVWKRTEQMFSIRENESSRTVVKRLTSKHALTTLHSLDRRDNQDLSNRTFERRTTSSVATFYRHVDKDSLYYGATPIIITERPIRNIRSDVELIETEFLQEPIIRKSNNIISLSSSALCAVSGHRLSHKSPLPSYGHPEGHFRQSDTTHILCRIHGQSAEYVHWRIALLTNKFDQGM